MRHSISTDEFSIEFTNGIRVYIIPLKLNSSWSSVEFILSLSKFNKCAIISILVELSDRSCWQANSCRIVLYSVLNMRANPSCTFRLMWFEIASKHHRNDHLNNKHGLNNRHHMTLTVLYVVLFLPNAHNMSTIPFHSISCCQSMWLRCRENAISR